MLTKEWPAHGTGGVVFDESGVSVLASIFDHVKLFKSRNLNAPKWKIYTI